MTARTDGPEPTPVAATAIRRTLTQETQGAGEGGCTVILNRETQVSGYSFVAASSRCRLEPPGTDSSHRHLTSHVAHRRHEAMSCVAEIQAHEPYNDEEDHDRNDSALSLIRFGKAQDRGY